MAGCDVLVICAHPDDQVAPSGGTMAKYASEGKKVHTIVMTYGALSQPHLKRQFLSTKIRKECKRANEALGCGEIEFLGYREGRLSKEPDKVKVRKELVDKMRKLKPKTIISHRPEDPHPDRKTIAKVVLEEAERLGCEVLAMERMALFNLKSRDYPKKYVDISEYFKKKRDALKLHKSQNPWRFLIWPAIYIRAFINGWKSDSKQAEMFYKLR